MNKSKKLRQMRKFIMKQGEIDKEYTQPPDWFYRKGSYFASFLSLAEPKYSILTVQKNKYLAYKSIVENIKYIAQTSTNIY